jgi:hypothetical protein
MEIDEHLKYTLYVHLFLRYNHGLLTYLLQLAIRSLPTSRGADGVTTNTGLLPVVDDCLARRRNRWMLLDYALALERWKPIDCTYLQTQPIIQRQSNCCSDGA